jgi:hypothetical protein
MSSRAAGQHSKTLSPKISNKKSNYIIKKEKLTSYFLKSITLTAYLVEK